MSDALDGDNENEDNNGGNNVEPVVDENGAAADVEDGAGDATASGLDQDENSGMAHPKWKFWIFQKLSIFKS